MSAFFDATLGGLIGSSITGAVVGALFLRRNKTLESTIQARFNEAYKIFESTRSWKEQALSELFGPLVMQLERTGRAFKRWKTKNLHLEEEVIRRGNLAVRDLLLAKGHLIPPTLMNDATLLVEHYDAWLEAYEDAQVLRKMASGPDFVFVGPEGFPFPHEAETNFRRTFEQLQKDLYDTDGFSDD